MARSSSANVSAPMPMPISSKVPSIGPAAVAVSHKRRAVLPGPLVRYRASSRLASCSVNCRPAASSKSQQSTKRLGLSRLARVNVHARHAVFSRDAFFRHAAEAIEVFLHAHFPETHETQKDDELCLRQSAGNSTRPKIDVAPDRFGELVGNDNVGVQKVTAWSEH